MSSPVSDESQLVTREGGLESTGTAAHSNATGILRAWAVLLLALLSRCVSLRFSAGDRSPRSRVTSIGVLHVGGAVYCAIAFLRERTVLCNHLSSRYRWERKARVYLAHVCYFLNLFSTVRRLPRLQILPLHAAPSHGKCGSHLSRGTFSAVGQCLQTQYSSVHARNHSGVGDLTELFRTCSSKEHRPGTRPRTPESERRKSQRGGNGLLPVPDVETIADSLTRSSKGNAVLKASGRASISIRTTGTGRSGGGSIPRSRPCLGCSFMSGVREARVPLRSRIGSSFQLRRSRVPAQGRLLTWHYRGRNVV